MENYLPKHKDLGKIGMTISAIFGCGPAYRRPPGSTRPASDRHYLRRNTLTG